VKVQDRCVVVTGAASGIGAALARRFHADGARRVVIADRQAAALQRVAAEIGAIAVPCDVTDEQQIRALVDTATSEAGPIDLFCSNAGVIAPGGEDATDDEWRLSIDVNVMAHIYAARAVVPSMLERGDGYLLQTASAAGLLTQIGSAPYSVTKHAAFAFAEWLSITYGDRGIKVSVLAPQAVRTAMTAGTEAGGVAGLDGMLEPAAVADAVIAGLEAESFLILPHPEVLEYFRRKADDYERWIRGMRRLQARFGESL
jgi:NAD(P)-dependent dehydrogenase (short-subunit alcohol dehydrogenase family)